MNPLQQLARALGWIRFARGRQRLYEHVRDTPGTDKLSDLLRGIWEFNRSDIERAQKGK